MTTTTIAPEIRPGDMLRPDCRQAYYELLPGEPYCDASFPGCQFRLDGYHTKVCVNVYISGRKPQYRRGTNAEYWRCQIEFIHDGDASVWCGGSLAIRRP